MKLVGQLPWIRSPREHRLRCTTPRLAVLAALMTDPDAGHRSAAQIHRRLVADGRGLDLASVPTTVDGID